MEKWYKERNKSEDMWVDIDKNQREISKNRELKEECFVSFWKKFNQNVEYLNKVDKYVFEAMEKCTDDYLYITDIKTNYTIWSSNTIDEFELPGKEMYGANELWKSLILPEDREIFEKDFEDIKKGVKNTHFCDYRMRNRKGEYVWIRCRGYMLRAEDGTPIFFIGLARNLGKREKIDAITSLLSVYELQVNLKHRLQDKTLSGGMLLLGLDDFKKINAIYSYSYGNEVLRAAAQAIEGVCPLNAEIYRLEGDKFVVYYPHCDKREMQELFDIIRIRLRHTFLDHEKEEKLQVSAGAVMFTQKSMSVDDIHKSMEMALYVSKHSGKEKLTFFTEELMKNEMENLNLREMLRKSVENQFEGFQLVYQPICYGESGRLSSCEALLRFYTDQGEKISPAQFIPILEDTGLILPVGRWVISSAVEQLRVWKEKKSDMRMSVNISYVQMKDKELGNFIKEELERNKISPESLVLELTESYKIENYEHTREFVNSMRKHGLMVALDDFGSGYASMSVLREIPFDWTKLDHEFVSKIENNEFDRSIVRHLIELTHSLGMKICVEGIEDKICYRIVGEEKPDCMQGYFLGYPVPAEEFERFL